MVLFSGITFLEFSEDCNEVLDDSPNGPGINLCKTAPIRAWKILFEFLGCNLPNTTCARDPK